MWSISKKTRSFVPHVAGCCVQIFSLHLRSWSKMNRLNLQKIHKALQVQYLLTVVCYTLFNVNRKRGMRGLWFKTGFVQHLNHSGGMTNQLNDSSTRDGNLWSLCCSAGILLHFREVFLRLESGLLQCNPRSSCLAYDRHGGPAISFLFVAAFCVFNDCYSPLSPLFCQWTHTPQSFPEFWLILLHFSHLLPAEHSYLSAQCPNHLLLL